MDLKMRPPGLIVEAHVCPTCHETFETAHFLQRHLQRDHHHVPSNIYYCPCCELTFHLLHQLEDHQRAVHASKEKLHECLMCHKKFVMKYRLDHHLLIQHGQGHGGPKTIQQVAPYPFFGHRHHHHHHHHHHHGTPSTSTTASWPYKCPLCDYAGRTKSLLNKHLRRRSNHHSQGQQNLVDPSQTEMPPPPPPPPLQPKINLYQHDSSGGGGGSRLQNGDGGCSLLPKEKQEEEKEEEEEVMNLEKKPPINVKSVVAAFLRDKAKAAGNNLA